MLLGIWVDAVLSRPALSKMDRVAAAERAELLAKQTIRGLPGAIARLRRSVEAR